MVEEMTDITKKRGSEKLHIGKNLLVLGLNKHGEIVQFNKECENITGYTRDEVLNRKMTDFLISKKYIKQWNKLFESVKNNVWIDDFTIPLNTKMEDERLIAWSSYPVEGDNRSVKNVSLLGKYLAEGSVKKQSFKPSNEIRNKQKEAIQNQNKVKSPDNKTKNKVILKFKNKKIVFRKNRYTSSEKTINNKKNRGSGVRKTMKKSMKKAVSSAPIEQDTMDRSVKELLKKYDAVNAKLRDLEKKDRKLERKNKKLEKDLNNLNATYVKNKKIKIKKQKDEAIIAEKITGEHKVSSKKLPGFLYDPFGVKKRQEEFEHRIYILDEHKKEFEELEAKLIEDRKDLDKRIAKFSTWKEKLLGLESEIEKRRKDLVEQEKLFRGSLSIHPVAKIGSDEFSSKTEDTLAPSEDIVHEDYHEILDKIPQCAAIIQRSILRQINSSFAELIGFEADEIVEKSLFDFIAPEGLVDIEKYYLSRLKGSNRSTYETVFSTKDDNKITVEVSIKPTTYNGEKAEIAIIDRMEEQQVDADISVKEGEDKQEVVSITGEVEGMQEDSAIEKEEDKQENVTTEKEKKQEDAVTEKSEDTAEDKPEEVTAGKTKKSQEEIDAMIKAMKDKQK